MTRYIVTEEIKTTWWKNLLRGIGAEEPREEFDIVSKNDNYQIGDIINTGTKKLVVKIVGKYAK